MAPIITMRGVLQLLRPIPLLVWSLPTIGFGFFLESGRPSAHVMLATVLAALGAIVLQGLITHGLNDVYDWQSGTDQISVGVISGGSKVLADGLLNIPGIITVVRWAVLLYGGLAVGMVILRGWGGLVWALVALWGSVSYSVPPLRLSYRPLGEWGALLPAMVGGVMLGGMAKNPHPAVGLYVGAAWFGFYCMASVMQHHLSDVNADWQARPQKRTTPAWYKHVRGRSPLEVILAYELLALTVAGFGMTFRLHGSEGWTIVSILAFIITATTTPNASVQELTIRDIGLKMLVLGALASAMLGGLL